MTIASAAPPVPVRVVRAPSFDVVMAKRISVIIPTWNEAKTIEGCLAQFDELPGEWESIVVDGGSTDGTSALARKAGADQVLDAPRGRGRQLDRGARAASESILLFLHADVRLPVDAGRWIRRTLAEGAMAGSFRTRTEPTDASGWWYAPLLRIADVRSRFTRRPYGDQGLFLSAQVYRETDGFQDLPLLEDLDYAARLSRVGCIHVVPASVRVSGRRFESGPLRAIIAMNTFPTLYRCGVPPRWLARLYGNPR